MSQNIQALVDQIKDLAYPMHQLPDIMADIAKSLADIKDMMADDHEQDPPSQYVKEVDMMLDNHIRDFHSVTPEDLDKAAKDLINHNISDKLRIISSFNTMILFIKRTLR